MKLLYKLWSSLSGKNLASTPIDMIKDQLFEPRALPMGIKEFDDWSDRIIAGAAIDGGHEDPEAFKKSQRYVLANMIMHLGPTESHKPDAHFIHSLRKTAANQIADSIRRGYYEEKAEVQKQVNIEYLKEKEGLEPGVDAVG